jgi:hypothetical protein
MTALKIRGHKEKFTEHNYLLMQVDSNKKEKMEEIPLEEKKEPDTDTKSQV